MTEKMCSVHFVPSCRLCEKPDGAQETQLAAPVTHAVADIGHLVSPPEANKPEPAAQTELTDPKAKIAQELSEAYQMFAKVKQTVSELTSALGAAKAHQKSLETTIKTLQKELIGDESNVYPADSAD